MVVTSAAHLLDQPSLELAGVVFYHLEAHLDEDTFIPSSVDPDFKSNFGLALRLDDGKLGVRMVAKSDLGQARILVDAAITYEYDPTVVVPESVGVEFANRVGLMALYPYVRQMFAQLSNAATGTAIHLPMLKQGDVAFTVPAETDD